MEFTGHLHIRQTGTLQRNGSNTCAELFPIQHRIILFQGYTHIIQVGGAASLGLPQLYILQAFQKDLSGHTPQLLFCKKPAVTADTFQFDAVCTQICRLYIQLIEKQQGCFFSLFIS